MISKDIKDLYNFFNWKLPSKGNGCLDSNIYCGTVDVDREECIKEIRCTEDNQYIEVIVLDLDKIQIAKNFDFNKFPMLSKLRYLELRNGNINVLPSRFFELPSLTQLLIENSKIKTIPKNININSPLFEISLDENEIEEFPYHFKFLKELNNLYLNNNKIKGTLSKELLEFEKLTILDLANNNLSGEVIIPNSLDLIDIENNQFNTILDDNSQKSLTVIYASGNRFNENFFEYFLKYYKNITRIDINDTKFQNVPSLIKNIESLTQIEMKNCGLKSISSDFFKLKNLEYINFSDNPDLNAKLINFRNSPIEECNFDNTNITCIQHNTCNYLSSYNGEEEEEIKIRKCTREEIDEVVNSMSKDEEIINNETKSKSENDELYNINDSNNSISFVTKNKNIIIISGVVVIVILLLLILWWKVFKNNNKNENIELSEQDDDKIKLNNDDMIGKNFLENENINNQNCNTFLNYNIINFSQNDNILPSYKESNDKEDIISDTEFLIYPNEKKDSTKNIVDAEVIDSKPSDYDMIVERFTKNKIENTQNLPPYVEIVDKTIDNSEKKI